MALKFRNITVDPGDPVADWGFEGLLTAVDRGSIEDWSRVAGEFERLPWGEVAATFESEVADAAEDPGVVDALRRVLQRARARAAQQEREEVAQTLREALAASGMTREEFARRLGTSRSRLSTYLSGKVVPGATLVVRARRIAQAP
ncbi:MAG: helix-turn-helix transcriptional regulator [Actinobacteria bacterium]|jgi:DNA-binding transcriptional regulator YiaG|nr:helix-turn-helix transcriptional regulator [Actinomycetota bacterium]